MQTIRKIYGEIRAESIGTSDTKKAVDDADDIALHTIKTIKNLESMHTVFKNRVHALPLLAVQSPLKTEDSKVITEDYTHTCT